MNICIICKNHFTRIPFAHQQKCCSKECSKINSKNYHQIYRSIEKNKLKAKQYRLTDICKQSVRNYHNTDNYKQYIDDMRHSKKYKQTQMKYWQSEKGKATLKKYYSSDKGKKARKLWRNTIIGKYSDLKRREAKRNCTHNFSMAEWKHKCELTNGICPICKKYVGINKMTMDHIYALMVAYKDFIRTGVKRIYTINDVQPMCLSCNSSKSDKSFEDFEKENLRIK